MNTKKLIWSLAAVFMFHAMYSQKLKQDEIVKLNDLLNTTVASDLRVELKGDKAICSIEQLSKTLDIRDSAHIAEDSLSKAAKTKLYQGRYVGPVFWKYNFQTATSSEVVFKPNKYQKLFCTIHFNDQDTIVIRSGLNTYTSYHSLSDSASHIVNWTGDKYISLLLTPKKVDNKIEFELNGITISGKFERSDKKELAKNYTKSLRTIFKREFKTLFESEEMSQLVSQKVKL
ncbi:hypothetical protein [Winogradskyella sp. SM1960]|uniref:hypothetical protein n=1 Tax=Winogradskyella sp. SM1960 TaxID=2865955 RepID=UPI001CD1C656|nr:hypothetical protein [Winogradskyella sp. SM1960]